jgi:hypothetical protein
MRDKNKTRIFTTQTSNDRTSLTPKLNKSEDESNVMRTAKILDATQRKPKKRTVA